MPSTETKLELLSDLAADGLIRRTTLGFEVTTEGRFFIRYIAMRFDAYLPKSARRFSGRGERGPIAAKNV